MDRRVGADHGFSLVELMIAVAVLAVLSSTVVLSVARPQSGMRSDLARFQSIYEQQKALAVISKSLTGVAIKGTGIQRLHWRGSWQPQGQGVDWRGEVSVLQPFDRDAPIVFTPSGQSTALRVQFIESDQSTICSSDGWEPLVCSQN